MTSNRRVTEALLTASVLGIVLGAVLLSYFTFYRPHRAEALIESWTGHSWVQEVPGWRQNIKPLGIIETTGWMSHYNNAVGSWNGDINDDPFWWAQSWEYGHVHVLETGSFEEAYLDSVMWDLGYEHFYSCKQARRTDPWAVPFGSFRRDRDIGRKAVV